MSKFDLDTIRHSTAHILADAVKRLYPGVKLGIGPCIEDGFYYDFDFPKGTTVTGDDLAKIEEVMKEIIKSNQAFRSEEVAKADAKKLLEEAGESFKVDLLGDLEGDTVTFYKHGDFNDLCRGPHVKYTKNIKAYKLLKVAGAYWRGTEANPMLTRIYGTAFESKQDLEDYLLRLEEAAKRDHRRLGKDLELYSTMDEFGPGLVLWHPMGSRIRCAIEDFWRNEHFKNGYEVVFTPHIARLDLWKTSGHLDFYSENMYAPMDVDEIQYELRPMNCPFHIQIYKTKLRSYREFPMRWAELGTVYRYERSGVLHGLMRVRGFTQDDAHIFCRPDQLEDEIKEVFDFSLHILRSFGFTEYEIYLSTKPEKHVGSDDKWDLSTKALKAALDNSGLEWSEDPGEGVFYGPKIDIKIKDSIGRSWQCTTIQVDFNLPERFELGYVGHDGHEHQPIMIHRALMGSLERFFGILIEHYAGAFPVWLAPVQARLLTITDSLIPYASEVKKKLVAEGLRVELDDRSEKLGAKIRDAQLKKTPYMLVIGNKEAENGSVSVRSRKDGDLGAKSLEEFVSLIKKNIEEKI
jgi:threonyl-tRNA synthetase